ncbi:MAG: hypothetical protein ACTSQE_04730 [Candidatus Heimdallarchaeaceae archaeon]
MSNAQNLVCLLSNPIYNLQKDILLMFGGYVTYSISFAAATLKNVIFNNTFLSSI